MPSEQYPMFYLTADTASRQRVNFSGPNSELKTPHMYGTGAVVYRGDIRPVPEKCTVTPGMTTLFMQSNKEAAARKEFNRTGKVFSS